LQITYAQASIKEKPSAFKREHPALQNMKFLNFLLFLLVIFALLDPDLIESDPTRIRIRNIVKEKSERKK
jgi:hypothetical protein